MGFSSLRAFSLLAVPLVLSCLAACGRTDLEEDLLYGADGGVDSSLDGNRPDTSFPFATNRPDVIFPFDTNPPDRNFDGLLNGVGPWSWARLA